MITPVMNIAELMPQHGTVSIKPADKWEDGLAAGNGIMGAMLYGDPRNDIILGNHCKLWLPLGSTEKVPDVGEYLPEIRRIIAEKGYQAGQDYTLAKYREKGWSGNLIWTDAFHPGFFLDINQSTTGDIHDYARIENFSTGEIWAQWRTQEGAYERRLFVSKSDNIIAVTTNGPKGAVSLSLNMQKLGNDNIQSQTNYDDDFITMHNVYVHGKGGYDVAIRVLAVNGTKHYDGTGIRVADADSVTLLMRILPYRIPLEGSQAWVTSPDNPDFSIEQRVDKNSVQIAGKEYNPNWMEQLKDQLLSLPADYNTLLNSHTALWAPLFERVSIDLNADPAQRGMSSEALLDLAQQTQTLPAALLERMYDAGRYVYMCSAGSQTPPNLFGIWSGTWIPVWSGDYTTDTNLQLDTELAYSANLAECMDGYFYLWDSYLPDFRLNARNLYGCRGILTGSRASNNGLSLHYDNGWPGNLWTPGASWIAHWYYDHYLYTGDKEFLRNRAIPFMKECALFWEDFLKGTEDSNGCYTFTPSYSAENGWGDNTSQDIEITYELLANLIEGCETLGVEQVNIAHWKEMLAKLPPLLINEEGQLKEWSNPTQGEQNDHRHLMHLYGAFESQQFTDEGDPTLYKAAVVALKNRVEHSNEDSTHGFMHTGLSAAILGLGDVALERLERLAKGRSIFPSMVDAHNGGPWLLCDDGNGSTPEIVNRMILQSKGDRIKLLPALPAAFTRGSLCGTRLRGAITMNEMSWDIKAGELTAILTSDHTQTITIVFPPKARISDVYVNGEPQPVSLSEYGKYEFTLPLQHGITVTIKSRIVIACERTGVPTRLAID